MNDGRKLAYIVHLKLTEK